MKKYLGLMILIALLVMIFEQTNRKEEAQKDAAIIKIETAKKYGSRLATANPEEKIVIKF